jgi:penicillin-binding protein 2
MVNKRGSVVAIEPSTGEILAMVTAPSYDPNLIALDRNRGAAFDSLLQDTINRPFLDRSVMAYYPPGSIFKPILSLIALQKGVLYPNKTIYCDGVYELDSKGKSVQRCHSHPTPYNVSIAIEHSCNSYFYQTMRDFVNQYGYQNPGKGLDTLVSYLFDFGLGKSLGTDILSEGKGFIPDSKFYDKVYRREVNGWRSTYILSVGIGQGELQVTTLQMANLAVILANRGYFYTPHLIKKYIDSNQQIDQEFRVKKKVRIDQEYYEPVITGMQKAINSGTATAGYVAGLDICGKTGTSENPFGKDHSVFFGFAPKDNPKIAIAVYVENAGWGGEIATPIGSLVIEKYLNKEISDRRKYVEEKMINKDLISITPNL